MVDQNAFGNEWASLDCFSLPRGATVSLSSITPAGDAVTELAYDAMAFVPAARELRLRRSARLVADGTTVRAA